MPRPTNSVIEREKALLREGLLSCRKCGETKSLSDFGKMMKSHTGYQVWCKDCTNDRNRQYNHANPVGKEKKLEYQRRYREKNGPPSPETNRRKHLWRLYRITPEQYDEMLAAQGGICAICGSANPKSQRGGLLPR